ncbi:MAG: heavy-metal-associated domain-containing protein [Flavobacterium sp.]|nr:heavy-metal-associated domain-containing protein [Flavobacterium sp.]
MKFTKSLLSLAIAGLLFTACKETAKEVPAAEAKTETAATASTDPSVSEQAKQKAAVVGKVETASFHIEGMSCAVMCASKIEKELAAMDGVQKATVDFDKKTATVEYDNAKQSPEKLVAKVEAVADGKTYKVSDVKTTGDHATLMTGDPVKKETKKEKKAKKTDKKSCGTEAKKEAKGGCCSGKKHCSEEKTM